jgi:hypothetical protein
LDEKKFKGWDALLIHAENYSKHHIHEHRGYFRAMKEAFLPDDGKQAPSSKAGWPREACKLYALKSIEPIKMTKYVS